MENDFLNNNPFANILQTVSAPNIQPQDEGQEEQGEMEHQLMKGKNPDNAQPLLRAIQSLQQFITNSSSSIEIATARSIISLITRLIDRTQQSMNEKLPKDEKMVQSE